MLRRGLDSLHDLLDVHLGAAVRDEPNLVLVEVPLEVVQELPVEPELNELDHRAQYDDRSELIEARDRRPDLVEGDEAGLERLLQLQDGVLPP